MYKRQPEARTDYGTSLNIRAIHSDKKYIYTVGPEGFIPNPDGDVPPFVMAPDFYYTSDFGDTWNYVGGLPVGTYPLTLTSDDDYVYTAVYSPIPSNEQSGLWRLPKSDITNAGIEAVESGAEAEVRFADGMLEVSAVADRIIVYGLDGKPVSMAEGVSVLDVNSLDKGVYTYEIRVEGRRIAGKFII